MAVFRQATLKTSERSLGRLDALPRNDVLLDLDHKFKQLIRDDPRVTYALAYGSVPQGVWDRDSDLEYCVFLESEAIDSFDARAWLSQVSPVVLWVTNEWGTPNGLLACGTRVELHVHPDREINVVLSWPNFQIPPERMLIKDREGKLFSLLQTLYGRSPVQPEEDLQTLHDRSLNGLAFTANLLARRETLRAWEVHNISMRTILLFARLATRNTQHWLNATRNVEKDLPEGLSSELLSCTASAPAVLEAHDHALRLTKRLAILSGIDPRNDAREAIRQALRRDHDGP